eukprot:gene5023-4619_t
MTPSGETVDGDRYWARVAARTERSVTLCEGEETRYDGGAKGVRRGWKTAA